MSNNDIQLWLGKKSELAKALNNSKCLFFRITFLQISKCVWSGVATITELGLNLVNANLYNDDPLPGKYLTEFFFNFIFNFFAKLKNFITHCFELLFFVDTKHTLLIKFFL